MTTPAPGLERDGDVFVLDLGDGTNSFEPSYVAALTDRLHEVAAAAGPRALVVSAQGKHWSTGLDLDWLGANPARLDELLGGVHELFATALCLPVPTVAAIGGHAFAAGAMLSLALDSRVMRADRGYFCLPEVDLGLPFTPGMTSLIAARLPNRTAHEAMTTGRRYGGVEAMAAGIVDAVADGSKVLGAALDLARPLAPKASEVLGKIKTGLYAQPLAVLRDAAANAATTL